ncbi:MAG: hypothetical protein HKO53_16215 [Gemmatimonadetes bacterium]|nr:hypothetical protein [Gemmatimonadota bacterium]
MRAALFLVLLLVTTGGAQAQLTSPIGRPADAIDVGEAVAFPSETVAAQIRAALADPRNQASLDTLESVLANRAVGAAAPEDAGPSDRDPGPSSETTDDEGRAAVAAAGDDTGEDSKSEDVAVTPLPPAGADVSTVVATSGSMTWLRSRFIESRTAALRATTTARSALVALNLPSATYWISGILGALLLIGAAVWRTRSPSEDRSLKQARKLARRGVGVAEVARRTGLSRELIQLIEARRNRKEVA